MIVHAARQRFTESNKKLRRARRLYVFFARHEIVDDLTLEMVAEAMIESGLYALNRSLKDCKFGILRKLWIFDGGTYRGYDWHHWLREKGWSCGSWTKIAPESLSLAHS